MKFTLYARTDRVGSKCETVVAVDDDEWNDMDAMERERYMLDALWQSGMIEWGYEPAE